MEEILLLGIGGHAHSVVDSIEQDGKYRITGFLDVKERVGMSYKEYGVLGTDEMLEDYFKKGIRNAFVTIGYMGEGSIRNQLYIRLLQIGYQVPVIIDQTAALATNVKIGQGTFIGKNAVVNAGAEIGSMCIINSAAVVEHDCQVGNFSHLAVGAVLCGGVQVGEQTFIGAGATVIQNVTIGDHVLVGAGTVITKDVSDNIIKYGAVEKKRKEDTGNEGGTR